VKLAGGQPPGQERREHPLLREAEPVDDNWSGGPSHHLGVLLPAPRSCKTDDRL
jgi:hypothetical protein